MIKLTAPQLAALRFFALPDSERIRADRRPRRDLVGRLSPLGLLNVRTAWVHIGTTYRSKQRLAVVDVHVTDAGRALLAELPEE